MQSVLQDIGQRYDCNRVQLRWIVDVERTAVAKAAWASSPGLKPVDYSIDDLNWVVTQIRNREPVCIDDMREMPEEAASDRAAFSAQDVGAFLLMPLEIGGEIVGALTLAKDRAFRWGDTTQDEIAALTSIIAGAYWGSLERLSLAESESRYRAVVQDQTELIVRWTPDGVATWVNDAGCKYFGKSRKELVGTALRNYLAAEDWDKLQSEINQLTPNSPVRSGENRVLLSDGEIAWQDWLDRGIFDQNGALIEVQSVGRDISKRKIAEEKLARTTDFLRNKADIQSDLMSISVDNAEETFDRSLDKIAELYDADRIHLWRYHEDTCEFRWQYRWLPEGVTPALTKRSIDLTDVKWFVDQQRSGKSVTINRRAELPPQASRLAKMLESGNIETFVGIPLTVDGENFGFCTVAAERCNAWDELAINELRILIQTIAVSMSRFRAMSELKHRAAFESMLAVTTASLRDADAGHFDRVISDVLARIGDVYGLERANVTWLDESLPGFGQPIDWVSDGTEAVPVATDEFSWGLSKIMRGQILQIDDVELMPAEASRGQAVWRSLGFASVLGLPLSTKGRVFGAATFAVRDQQDWDKGTVEELKLLANAITTAAIRQWSNAELLQRQQDLMRSQRDAGVGSYKVSARINKDGNVEYLNASMSEHGRKIFAMTDDGDFAQQIISRVHPDDVKEVRRSWRNMLVSGNSYKAQYRLVQPDGSITHIQSRADVDRVDETGISKVFGTIKDVTDWVVSCQQLKQAMAEIGGLKDRLQKENLMLKDEVRAAHGFDSIVGDSEALRKVLRAAEQVAPTDVTVLVTGETGTGKELIARSIHELSPRGDKTMVSVNCAALAPELIASELFGHEKGAFTGAHAQRKGRFELADGGTLFLDEIGEMSVDLQAKLLRVIQEGEFERLGGTKTLKTDVRLIAATNRDLRQAVDQGEFRADLYYRINSFPVHLPPLRERREDIPLLVEYLTRKHARNMGKEVDSVSKRTMRYLRSQSWPGNVRELEGTIVRALITSKGNVLDYGQAAIESNALAAAGSPEAAESFLDAQRLHILDALDKTDWVIEGKNGAAQALGLAPSSLRSKMKRLEITRPA